MKLPRFSFENINAPCRLIRSIAISQAEDA
jgi:hypothetical protein